MNVGDLRRILEDQKDDTELQLEGSVTIHQSYVTAPEREVPDKLQIMFSARRIFVRYDGDSGHLVLFVREDNYEPIPGAGVVGDR